MKIEIWRKERERDKILAVLFGNRRNRPVEPMIHTGILMDYIRHDAAAHYGCATELDDLLRRTYVRSATP